MTTDDISGGSRHASSLIPGRLIGKGMARRTIISPGGGQSRRAGDMPTIRLEPADPSGGASANATVLTLTCGCGQTHRIVCEA